MPRRGGVNPGRGIPASALEPVQVERTSQGRSLADAYAGGSSRLLFVVFTHA